MLRGLSLDVLLQVIRVSPLRDALAVISTCRTLRCEGSKTLLLENEIRIDTGGQLASFLTFLNNEELPRFRYLRALYLNVFTFPPTVTEDLTEAFPHMTQLETLTLIGAELLYVYHPEVASALAALTSIRHLRVVYAGDRACIMLKAFKSRLVSASLVSDCHRYSSWDTYHPLHLVAGSADTLEDLTTKL
ncbi:hypothetical protein DICSQDRAFT_132502 [Dichomitus squalens LYAD-421 SS1]|uniref:F-box domain-containing protein n=1 Tax=Dichomitus squalens TaxID=114155 RepID=A0A4Q9N7N6_9APHY|nr:uncharacterized protein DICSQDRAFT_132502 [Dichomitus squalens LYAD-421 SS1]EJF66358.1 hypothetical protein DICSQDRAFT_132502 [Dichomitus squalens LYAD-421 SS1]TBU35372.1 hypothetical protein BD311DRAFT_662 [Dichomitus squalens]